MTYARSLTSIFARTTRIAKLWQTVSHCTRSGCDGHHIFAVMAADPKLASLRIAPGPPPIVAPLSCCGIVTHDADAARPRRRGLPCCECSRPFLALLGLGEMSDLSPEGERSRSPPSRQDTPLPRTIQCSGIISATPVLSGLHH